MSRSILIPALLITCLPWLTGCHLSVSGGLGKKRAATPATHAAPKDAARLDAESEPAPPPIRGAWSEPVNGIRMMVQQIVQQDGNPEPRDFLTLMVFAWNTTDQRVAMPPIMAEREVMPYTIDGEERERFASLKNLRILAKPLERRLPDIRSQAGGLEELREVQPPLEPGEIRLHALQIRLIHGQMQEEMQQLAKRQANTVPASRVDWYNPQGEYILHLTYRPEGFNGQDTGVIHRTEDVAGWECKQIDLPPIRVRVSDPNESPQ